MFTERPGCVRVLLLALLAVLPTSGTIRNQPTEAPCAHWATSPEICALNTVWSTPTKEPGVAHRNTNGPVISGGMPLGNGETAVLAFPLVPINGSNFLLPPDAGSFLLQNSK
jgi:hypothetical protein